VNCKANSNLSKIKHDKTNQWIRRVSKATNLHPLSYEIWEIPRNVHPLRWLYHHTIDFRMEVSYVMGISLAIIPFRNLEIDACSLKIQATSELGDPGDPPWKPQEVYRHPECVSSLSTPMPSPKPWFSVASVGETRWNTVKWRHGLPSGYVKIAIENGYYGHRKSGFTQLQNGDVP